MTIRYFFKNMSRSQALESHIKEKLESALAFTDHSVPVNVRISQENRQASVQMDCHALDRYPVEVHGRSEDFIKSVDLAAERLTRVVKKRKGKRQKMRFGATARQLDENWESEVLEQRKIS